MKLTFYLDSTADIQFEFCRSQTKIETDFDEAVSKNVGHEN